MTSRMVRFTVPNQRWAEYIQCLHTYVLIPIQCVKESTWTSSVPTSIVRELEMIGGLLICFQIKRIWGR